jgi:hypothetical protein
MGNKGASASVGALFVVAMGELSAASHYVLGQGIIGPLGRLNNTAHNKPHALTIDLLDNSSSDQSIKLVSFHSGDSFVFLDLPLARIVGQSAAYQSVSRLSAMTTSQCSLELIQTGV